MSVLSDYLANEINHRGWSMRELSLRANLSHTQVADVINGRANPGAHFCIATARALGEMPEKILRLAGILPPLPPTVADEREATYLLRHLPDEARALFMTQLRAIAEPYIPYNARQEKSDKEQP